MLSLQVVFVLHINYNLSYIFNTVGLGDVNRMRSSIFRVTNNNWINKLNDSVCKPTDKLDFNNYSFI
jgi:hypothetical protein